MTQNFSNMQNIDIFPWDDNFKTGIEIIDTQHYQLVSILNKLATNIAYEVDSETLNTIFDELIDYTLYHFKTEEALWHQYLPSSELEEEHHSIHQEFIDIVLNFKNEQHTRSFDELTKDILSFLARWLASHILETDRYMAYIIIALQDKFSLNEAKEIAKKKMGGLTNVFIDIVLSRYRSLSSNAMQLIREVQQRKQKEEKLQLAASVFTHAREGILITDASNIIIDVNDTFSLITGYSSNEVIGATPKILASGKQSKKFYVQMWKELLNKGYWNGEIWNRNKSGKLYAAMLTISAILDSTGKTKNYVALFSDITTAKEHQKQLEHIANYDALTNLPNRVLLADKLSQALLNSQQNHTLVAVAFLDIDGFKEINDKYGHNVGDKLLIILSRRMNGVLSKNDTMARVGGDEFLVILTQLKKQEDCIPIMKRLLKKASTSVTIDGLVMRVSVSIGLSISIPGKNIDGDHLIRQADQSMYKAKQSGKNYYYIFDFDKDNAISTKQENITQIKRALECEEFVLYYQPKVNMRTGSVLGVEALIRWNHPTKGLLLPTKFLPCIENHTINIELGEWVIDRALTQIESWAASGLDMHISINVSVIHLQQTNFVSHLKSLLKKHPLANPSLLEIEVLETGAIGDIVQISDIMEKCIDLGVTFALDDFGTGYSSLTYLRRLPADLIKIDQVFVYDMLVDPDDLAIVEGVIGLSKAFGRNVIAEGVETIEQGKALLQIGCEWGQGYAIAEPMPTQDIPKWKASWKPNSIWSEFISGQEDFHINSEVDHQHWIIALQDYLNGKKNTPPPMDPDKCHIGHWLKEEGFKHYRFHPQFKDLVETHKHMHFIGRKLIDLYKNKNYSEVKCLKVELLEIYNSRIKKLEEILS